MDFSGRRVLVTGGVQGIGLGIVKRFLHLGAHVVVLDKNEKGLESLTAAHGKQVTTVQVDLSDWHGTKAAVKGVLPIHHLINNVGVLSLSPLIEASLSDVDLMFNLNFKSALAISQVVAAHIIETGIEGATIVNISSVADSSVRRQRDGGIVGAGLYSCTKAAVTMLTKYLAAELLHSGIRVNCVRPGLVNTELLKAIPQDIQELTVKPISANMIYEELIEPEDIGTAAVILSSPLTHRMTGSALTVDGGYEIQ